MRADSEFEALVSELLKSGVSPKYVSRLAGELEDHFADLEEEARRFGVPEEEAPADALERLGAAAAIAREFAQRPELNSWIHRYGWIDFLRRVLLSAYLALVLPWHIVAASQGTLLRYSAAAAGGSGITVCLLLVMTLVLSPENAGGIRLANMAAGVGPAHPWAQDPRASAVPALAPEPSAARFSHGRPPSVRDRAPFTLLPLEELIDRDARVLDGLATGSPSWGLWVPSLPTSGRPRTASERRELEQPGFNDTGHLAGDAVSGD